MKLKENKGFDPHKTTNTAISLGSLLLLNGNYFLNNAPWRQYCPRAEGQKLWFTVSDTITWTMPYLVKFSGSGDKPSHDA